MRRGQRGQGTVEPEQRTGWNTLSPTARQLGLLLPKYLLNSKGELMSLSLMFLSPHLTVE